MMEVRYATTKPEIMRWYWRRWKAQLWRFHLLLLLLVLLSNAPGYFRGSVSLGSYLGKSIAWGLFAIVLMVLYPILRHKTEERVLTLGAGGIVTVIGKKSGTLPWEKVASIEEFDGCVCITGKNRNGFVVPGRAFADEEAKAAFVDFIRKSIAV